VERRISSLSPRAAWGEEGGKEEEKGAIFISNRAGEKGGRLVYSLFSTLLRGGEKGKEKADKNNNGGDKR